MKLNFRKVCLFWGMMDVFYIVRLIWLNAEQGRIPFIDDVIGFSQMYSEYGGGFWVAIIFLLSMILNVSIIFSAIFLIVGWSKVRYFVFAQIPFRLLITVPSFSFVAWLLKQLDVNNSAVFFVVLVFSEILKVLSFVFSRNNNGC